MKVGVVFGGRSVEHLVSIRSAKTVREGLQQAGHDVVCLYIDERGSFHDATSSSAVITEQKAKAPESAKPARSLQHLVAADVDAVFAITHGTFGEDGTLQGLLEMLDLPYVGCATAASAVAMDKLLSKRLFAAAGIPVVPYAAITRGAFEARGLDDVAAFVDGTAFPLFVKPAVGGSSVGCRKVKERASLRDAVAFALSFDETALIEVNVSAREVEIAVLGADASSMQASVPGEIVPGADFYDYADKYLKDDAKLLAPAPVDAAVTKQLQAAAIAAMGSIGGAGLARVDFFLLPDNSFYLNEINTLPGFTNVSMYPRLWALSGVALPQLCDRLVQLGVERHRRRAHIDASLQEFVRSAAAGKIAL
ncbi:MAG: D-alanine--D-alanine ligase family protein [Deltaproteobacteria bacterium]|nr:D-alanine--D-alanine ligase family protein [Deltaproteobacteria bacterium]